MIILSMPSQAWDAMHALRSALVPGGAGLPLLRSLHEALRLFRDHVRLETGTALPARAP